MARPRVYPGATNLHTPSYGAIARAGTRTRPRHHGPLGIAVPETDNLDVKKWKGRVVRLAELSIEERRALGDRTLSPPPSEIHTWLCRSCRTHTSNGAYKVGRCNHCHHPRGDV